MIVTRTGRKANISVEAAWSGPISLSIKSASGEIQQFFLPFEEAHQLARYFSDYSDYFIFDDEAEVAACG